MFSTILNIYPHDMVNRMIKSRCSCWIELIDGTIFRFAYAGDSARGMRANKVIIQPDISQTFSDIVLRHLLMNNSEMYVAADEGIKPAAIYYIDKEMLNAK